jgi:nucleoside-diphosphate-sugar epimerase
MYILVSGSSGFVTQHLVNKLLGDGEWVRILDLVLPRNSSLAPPSNMNLIRLVF